MLSASIPQMFQLSLDVVFRRDFLDSQSMTHVQPFDICGRKLGPERPGEIASV